MFRTEIEWKGKVSYEDKTGVLSWYFLTRLLNSKFRKQMDTLKYNVYRIYGCIFITNLPVLKAEKFNVIMIALKQVQEGTTTYRIRDWQGASSLFYSCYWDLRDHPAQNPAQNCWDHPAQNGRSGKELLPGGPVRGKCDS